MKRLLKFEKDGCVPCQMVGQFLDDKGVTYEKINPFNNPEKAIEFDVMSVPVVVLLDENGFELKRSIGFKQQELTDIINSL